MLKQIISFSLKNRLLVVVAALLLVGGGIFTASRMNVDVFPDLTAPTVAVITEAHGMAPEEVERLVTYPIETVMNGATGVRRVRSSSMGGISIIWVEFEWDTEIYKARQIVTEKLSTVEGSLPEGVGSPMLGPNTSIMGEIMLISITSQPDSTSQDTTSMRKLRTIADWQIEPSLLAIDGVAKVAVIGGERKQYQVNLNPLKMKFYDVSLDQVLEAVRHANTNSSGNFMSQHGNRYIVRGMARTSVIDEMGNTVVTMKDNYPVKLRDLAEVKVGSAPKIGQGAMSTQPAVIMTVMKQPNTNTLKLTDRIDQNIGQMTANLPNDIKVDTDIFRQSDFINNAVNNVEQALLEGSIFVIIILFIFLFNFRTTIISLVAIPLSLLVAVIIMYGLGFTINTMSLGGMAIAIGMVVDDAIIDVENVYKRLRENIQLPANEREHFLHVVYRASNEIRPSIMNATFIIVAAFIPLFFLSGMEGRMLQPLGVSFIISLFASLLVAVTVTPVMCSFLLTGQKTLQKQQQGSWVERQLSDLYHGALRKAMTVKWVILSIAAVLLIASIVIFTQLGRSFLPTFNEGSLVVNAMGAPGMSLKESEKIGTKVENVLLSMPEIETTTRRTGRAENDEHAQGVNAAEIDAPFTLKERSREAFFNAVREKLDKVKGANITLGQPIGHRIDHMLSGTQANIAIKVFGSEMNELYSVAKNIKSRVQDIEGLVDVNVPPKITSPQIQIHPKREMLARYGIPLSDFNQFVNVALGGEEVSMVFEKERSFPMVVRFNEGSRNKINKLKDIPISTQNGNVVPLGEVARIVSTKGPNEITREDVKRKVVVSANVSGRDQRSVVEEIKQRVDNNISLPEGYRVEYGGQFKSEQEASRRLMYASLVALLIVFLLLYQEFRKLSLATLVLANLPLALIGGVIIIWLTSGILSIPSIIGFITLFGIATRNGILLVSRFEAIGREETTSLSIQERVIRGSLDRLNPILMTALTASLALIPLALRGNEPGNEIQSPMAVVILGGLLSSTLLNLFVIPLIYCLLKKGKDQ